MSKLAERSTCAPASMCAGHLHHETLDQPVELGAIVVAPLAKQQEVVHRLRHEIGSKLQVEHAERGDQPHVAAHVLDALPRRHCTRRKRIRSRFFPGFLDARVHAQVSQFVEVKGQFAHNAVSICNGVLSAGL